MGQRRERGEESGTIGAALGGAIALLRGETPSPDLDAELLLTHVLRQPREHLLAHRHDPLDARTTRTFTSLVRRRAEGVPLPYLTGEQEFLGRRFIVTPAVMVPRPESEAIVTEALRLLDEVPTKPQAPTPLPLIAADIGTGSGVLAVSLAAEAPRVRTVATDRSPAALVVARRNARTHRVLRRVTLVESDLLTEIPPELAPTMIVANLPYVPSDDLTRAGDSLDTRGLLWEPRRALDGGPDGLFVIRRLLAQLAKLRTLNAELRTHVQYLILEHSPLQRRRILELAYGTLPTFRPHEVSPFVTSWSRR